MLRKLWALAAAIILSGVSIGQAPFYLDSPTGRYLVYQAETGPIMVPIGSVAVVPWPDPDTPPGPTPDKLAADVAKWATEIGEPQDSQRYALVFATARDALAADNITPAQTFTVASRSADAVLKTDWTAFRAKLTAYNTAAKQEGKLGSKTQLLNYAAKVRHGLEVSADGSEAISLDESLKVIGATNVVIDEVSK